MRDHTALVRLVTVACLALPIAACQTFGTEGLIASSAPAEISNSTADAIAGDLSGRLVELVGPGTGTIVLMSSDAPFASSLEGALRAKGYAVTRDGAAGEGASIPLAYVVTSGDGEILVRLSTRTLDLTRTYRETPTGAVPSSPLSILRRG
ncbi:conjugal transfer protein TrbH [Pinisolibacter sp.]|uniref:conjugal transfer protein TrbH n=1 Tax=Pinisolibacter sp. TaxID=2172024 RepID=UPI002FDE9C7A